MSLLTNAYGDINKAPEKYKQKCKQKCKEEWIWYKIKTDCKISFFNIIVYMTEDMTEDFNTNS